MGASATITLKALFDGADIAGGLGKIKKELSNLKLPPELQKSSTNAFDQLNKSLTEYERRIQNGFKGKGDVTGLEKNINSIISNFGKVESEMLKIQSELGTSVDLSKFLKLPPDLASKLQSVTKEISTLKNELNGANNNTNLFQQIQNVFAGIKGNKAVGSQKNFQKYLSDFLAIDTKQSAQAQYAQIDAILGKMRTNAAQYGPKGRYENAQNAQQTSNAYAQAIKILTEYQNKLTEIQSQEAKRNNLGTDYFQGQLKSIQSNITALNNLSNAAKSNKQAMISAAQGARQHSQEMDRLAYQVQYFFGINNAINLFKRSLRSAFNTVKELDKAMTETAVVTDYSVEDMWNKLPQYTAEANKLGATTKGAYETMTLYYQQGLNTNQAFALGTETMKMARIANMDYANATNMMTAALRGFNMELNETSAQRVNDVYSELAAITAADTSQIATAMTKTASIAANANMEFETTAAFLSQIIETTQEAPETAGTAMKTIIARFTEVKEGYMEGRASIVDEEGETADINKIDKALKTVGISLKDFLNGSKGIDDIFLELAERWDTLDTATQRYIATTAAGSRQQSRFIAMMSDYDRTMELVTAAQNSAGSGQEQFEKTLDSLESKLNQMHNAWDEFTMGLLDSGGIKLAVDGLTKLLNILNKLTSFKGGGALKLGLGLAGMSAAGTLLNTGIGVLAGKGISGAATDTMKAFYGDKWATMAASGAAVGGNAALTGAALAKEQRMAYGAMLGTRAFGPLWGLPGRIKEARQADAWLMGDGTAKSSLLTERHAALAQKYDYALTPQQMTQEGAYNSYWGRAGTALYRKGWGTEDAKGLKSLGVKLGATAGTASSALISLGATLGIFATAALAAYTAVKVWDNQHISLEEAKTAAENAQQAEEALADRRKQYTENLKSYNTAQEKVNNTTKGSVENLRAVAESNKIVLEMAEANPTLQYGFDASTGALTISNEEQQRVAADLAQQEKEASINALLAQAVVAEKQISENNKKLAELYNDQYINAGNSYQGPEESRATALEIEQLKNQNLTQEANQKALFTLAANEIAGNLVDGLGDVATLIGENAEQEYQDSLSKNEVGILRGKNWLINELKELTGLTKQEILDTYGDGQKLNKEEARLAIQELRAMSDFTGAVEQAAAALQRFANDYGKEKATALAGVLTGDKTADTSQILKNGEINGELVNDYFESIGVDMTDMTQVEKAWGQLFDGLKSVITQQETAKLAAENLIKAGTAKRLGGHNEGYQEVSSAHMRTYDAQLSKMSLDAQTRANYMAQDLANFGDIGESIFNDLLFKNGSIDNLEKYADLFSDINFNNPIQALKQINDYAENGSGATKEFGVEMKRLGKEDGPLSASAGFKFLNETIFADQDALEDFKNSTGEMDASGIEEMADQFQDLRNYMDECGVSASAVAAAVNAINFDGLNSKLITDNIIEALNQFNNFSDGINKTIKDWENLDLGEDYGAATDAFASTAKDIIEKVGQGEFGNAQVENFYDKIFGEGSYQKAIAEAGGDASKSKTLENNFKNINKWAEQAEKRGDLSGMFGALLGQKKTDFNFERESGVSGAFSITKNGNKLDFDFGEVLPTFQEMTSLLAKQLNVSEDTAELLLTDAANNSTTLRQIIDKDGIVGAIEALADDDDGIIDTAALKLIAEQTKNPEGFEAALNAIFGGKVEPGQTFTDKAGFEAFVNGLRLDEGVAESFKNVGFDVFNQMVNAFSKISEGKDGFTLDTWDGDEAYNAWKSVQTGDTSGLTGYEKELAAGMGFDVFNKDINKGNNFEKRADSSEYLAAQARAAQIHKQVMNGDATMDEYDAAVVEALALTGANEEYQSYRKEAYNALNQSQFGEGGIDYTKGENVAQLIADNFDDFANLQGEDLGKALLDAILPKESEISDQAKEQAIEYLSGFENAIGKEGSFDSDVLSKYLGEDGANDFIAQTAKQSGLDKITINNKTLEAMGAEPVTIPVTPEMTGADVQAALDAAYAQANADLVGEAVASAIGEIKISGDTSALSSAIDAACHARSVAISYTEQGGATGGYVPSYAKGTNRKLQPGPALTGEEAPEIVWNKERGYAYMAGAHGPEYNTLRPGDRVFNASETRRILANSRRNKRPSVGNALASGGYISGRVTPSYADASSYDDPGWFGGGGSGGGSGDKKKDKTYTELDWLYNLMEEIAQLEREQTELQRDLDKAMTDPDATIEDLVKLITDQISNLEHQLEASQMELEGRQLEMKELQEQNEKYSEYASYNEEEKRIEIDWDAIGAISDDKKRKEVEDYVKSLEEVQDKMDEAEDRIADTEDAIKEAQETLKDSYIDFEERVLDAIVTLREAEIDKLSEVNDSISDTNSKLLDAVQKSIDKQRQDRENARTEEDLSEKERRLAYLRQDTSKNNDLEIKQLEKELADSKEDYTDTLIDQKMSALQEQQDLAAEQRGRQIELMEAQLEFEKANGLLWAQVAELMAGGVGEDGKIDKDSPLWDLLYEAEEVTSKSEAQQQEWSDEVATTFVQAMAWLEGEGFVLVDEDLKAIKEELKEIKEILPENSIIEAKKSISSGGGKGSSNSGSGNNTGGKKPEMTEEEARRILESGNGNQEEAKKVISEAKSAKASASDTGAAIQEKLNMKKKKYSTGGLADFTGPAWLDGTKTKPELVLNARDTANFIQLKDVLSDIMEGGIKKDTEEKAGDVYLDIKINAELNNDYDVEKLTKKIKSEIYKDGAYRGVNIIRNVR